MNSYFRRFVRKCGVSLHLVMALLLLLPGMALAADSSVSQSTRDEISQLIGTYHVSGVSADELSGRSVEQMLEALNDPYTSYFSKEDWKQFENSLENQYVGIGVRVGQDDSGFFVDQVFEDSPAQKAELQPGDYFVQVEGVPTEGKSLEELVTAIKGPPGTTVRLTISRGQTSLEVKLIRAQIQLPVVESLMFDGKVGYLKLTDFSSDADEKFAAGLKDLKDKGIRSLIVDLRDNPGGLLLSALNIASNFIEDGVLIHTRDRNDADHPASISDGETQGIPVFVLVNENSASASEVLTGALQDYGKATVIGARTFGKGSVQNIFPLKDGGYLKLTVEEYLTPLKRRVNGVGLKPDVAVPDSLPQMITALRMAGSLPMSMQMDAQSLTINGQELYRAFPLIRENGKVYAPSRILAALVGAQVGWDEAAQKVYLTRGAIRAVYQPTDAWTKWKAGTSYIDLDRFARQNPGFQWKWAGDALDLRYDAGE